MDERRARHNEEGALIEAFLDLIRRNRSRTEVDLTSMVQSEMFSSQDTPANPEATVCNTEESAIADRAFFRITPQLINVQPMLGPTGEIFHLRSRFSDKEPPSEVLVRKVESKPPKAFRHIRKLRIQK